MSGTESISFEKVRARALRRLVFWRIVTTVFDFPRRVVALIGKVFIGISDILDGLSAWAFYFELDAATVYHNLTDLDLAYANGDEARYSGVIAEGDDAGADEL